MTAQTTQREDIQPHYGLIFGILALFTLMEIGLAYISGLPDAVKVAVLIFLAAFKVGLVLLWFMHLKFDNRFYALPFALGLVLVVPLIVIVMLTVPEDNNATTTATGESTAGQRAISVTETSYNISLSADSVPAGEVTFHISNEAGQIPHQFTIVQSDLAPGDLPLSNGSVDESQLNVVSKTESIASGGSTDLTVDLTDGNYVLFCNLPGHYQQGMYTGFTVTGGGPVPANRSDTPPPSPTLTEASQPTETSTPQPSPTLTSAAQSTATSAPTQAQKTTVTATETSYNIALSMSSVPAGTVTFQVVNNAGGLPHQFTIVKTDRSPDDLPLSDSKVDESQLEVVGKTDTIAPGSSADLTVDLAAGSYVFYCNLPGHYQQGMYTGFKVISSVSSSAEVSPSPSASPQPTPQTSPTQGGTRQSTVTPTTAQTETTSVTVTETTYEIALSTDSVPAGEVTFHISNEASQIPHQFTIVQTDLAPGNLPMSNGDVDESQLNMIDKTGSISPFSSVDLTVNLVSGSYVLFCNLPGHYANGMYAAFTVTN